MVSCTLHCTTCWSWELAYPSLYAPNPLPGLTSSCSRCRPDLALLLHPPQGYKTWCDTEVTAGDMVYRCKGIDHTKVILCFITKRCRDLETAESSAGIRIYPLIFYYLALTNAPLP